MKKSHSWSRPDGLPSLAGRKQVDRSVFFQGTGIPQAFYTDFGLPNRETIPEGTSEATLLLEGQEYQASLVMSNGRLRLLYGVVLCKRLRKALPQSYAFFKNEATDSAEEEQDPPVPPTGPEYLDFYVTDTPLRFRVEPVTQPELSDGAAPVRGASPRALWWVNQGDSYEAQSAGGYLWAPTKARDGSSRPFFDRMNELRKGDFVLHNRNGIVAVGEVLSDPVSAPKPDELASERWEQDGVLVKVKYSRVDRIRHHDIPAEWRSSGPGPFDTSGKPKLGYLYPVKPGFGEMLVRECGLAFPGFGGSSSPGGEYQCPSLDEICASVASQGLRIREGILRRYHLALEVSKFVVLAGVSGTGKTWLTKAYADSVGAKYCLVPVAPNWTTNEDLLGFFNPFAGKEGAYVDTPFSSFLRQAAAAYKEAEEAGTTAQPYHVVLDEMNLARVEYYFAKFLSAMEARRWGGESAIELAPGERVLLPPNLAFIGTVNVDETTHGFADKVFDRAQLIELGISRDDLMIQLGDAPFAEMLIRVWDALADVAPFAFRVVRDVEAYVTMAAHLGSSWQDALDEAIMQKVLPRVRGTDTRLGEALARVIDAAAGALPMTLKKTEEMLLGFETDGFCSYF